MGDSAIAQIRFRGLSLRKSNYGFEPGELTQAYNVAFDKVGTLVKRPGQNATVIGTTAITDKQIGPVVGPAALTGPTIGCFQFGQEEVRLASNDRIYSLASGGTRQISRDYFPEAVGTRRPLQNLSGSLDYLAPDVAVTTSGYEVYAWCAVSGEFAGASPVYTLVYEQATGAMVLQPSVPLNVAASAGVWTPKLAVVGGTLVVAVYADVSGNLYMRTMDTSGTQPFAWSSEVVLVASGSTYPLLSTPVYDVTVMAGDTHVVCAWTYSAGGGNFGVRVGSFSTAGTLIASNGTATFVSGLSATAIPLVTLAGSLTDQLYVGICLGIASPADWGVLAWGLSPTALTQTFALVSLLGVTKAAVSLPQQLGAIVVPVSGTGQAAGAAFVFGADDAVNSIPVTWTLLVSSAGVQGPVIGPQFNWWPCSRPFLRTQAGITKTYCMGYYPSAVQGTYFLVDLNTDAYYLAAVAGVDRWARPVCAIANRLASSVDGTQLRPNNSLANMLLVASGTHQFITPGHVLAGGGAPGQFRLWRLQVDFAHPNRGVSAALGHSAVFGSSWYDGQRATELGHYLFPEGYTATAQGSGGSLSAGVVQYLVIYSWTSASGETFRSTSFAAPNASPATQALSVTVVNSDSVKIGNLFAPPMSAMADAESNTGLGSNSYPTTTTFGAVNVEIYRTEANGTTLYLAATVPVPNQQALGLAGVTTYTDTMSDATIATQPILYFIPGGGAALECVSPPSFSHTIVYAQRVWGIGDDLRTIWFSKQYADGEAPGFNEELTLQVEDGTDIVCLLGFQGQLLVCTKKGWYVIAGTGPDDSGGGNDLTQPLPLNFEQVCSNILSIVQYPGGVIFQGANNQLYKIDASLNCTWFSDRVETILSPQLPYVLSAVWFPSRHELRFAVNNGVASTSTAAILLVYNTYQDAWTIWQMDSAAGGGVVLAGGGAAITAAMVSNVGGVPTYRWSGAYNFPGNTADTQWTEDTTGASFTDIGGTAPGPTFVPSQILTGWLNVPAVVGGYARIRRLVFNGDYFSPHDLTLACGSNYAAALSQSAGFTDAQTGLLSAQGIEELRIDVANQVSHAFRVSIVDGPPTAGGSLGAGRGCSFAAISFEYALNESGAGKFISTTQQG